MGKISEEKTGEKKKRGRNSCCEREGLRRGAWTAEEDKILVDFITENGHGTWRNLPKLAGLLRCGKSCRLRWTNYLRPDIKHGPFSPDEENTIIQLHESLGNKWAAIASHLPGRTDNDVKNFWNSHLRKRFSSKNLDRPSSSKPAQAKKPNSPLASHVAQWESIRLEAESRFSGKQAAAARPPDFPPGPNAVGPPGDYYLNLWNSEIGSSFRKEVAAGDEAEESSRSPTSQMSSSVVTKAEKSGAHGDGICEDRAILEEDSSDAMMKLLLDFPVGEDDDEDDDDVAISQGGNVNELED